MSTMTPLRTGLGHPAPPTPPPAADRLLPDRPATDWTDHLARLGPLPLSDAARLAPALDAAGLLGRGGAAFPTARKLTAVAAAVLASRLPAVVVANCCEGDPTSMKDKVLLHRSPQLVIDGAIAAAAAVGADRIVLAVHDRSPAHAALLAALGQRPPADVVIEVIGVPGRYIASEATALVRYLNTGDARPAGKLVPIWETGVGGRPTLVDNAETLAQLALIARFGPAWFAAVGTPAEPGTTLLTIGGAAPRPGVIEVPNGTPVRDILARSGVARAGVALFGGLAGRWMRLPDIAGIGYSTSQLAAVGATRGVGSIIVLPDGGCVLNETARMLHFQAVAGARQCGPCMFGLPAIADDMTALGRGDRGALDRLRRRLPVINGRGACSHPDGAVALAGSALAMLTSDRTGHLERHLATGGCDAPPPVVPLGAPIAQTSPRRPA